MTARDGAPDRDAALRRRVPGTDAVRGEDAFDVEAVAAWLRSTIARPRRP